MSFAKNLVLRFKALKLKITMMIIFKLKDHMF